MLTHYKNLILSVFRLLKEMGPLYGALVGLILVFMGAFLYTNENVVFSGGVSLGLILLIHFGRKDCFYLKHFFGKQRYWMLLGEYLLLGVVFLVSCIVNHHWQAIVFFLFALFCIPFLGSGVSSEQWQNFPLVFSKSSLVFKSGFRLYYPLWLVCLLLLYLISGLGKQDVFLVLVYVYVIIVSGFQAVGDTPFYIRISKSAGFYIKKKILSVLWDYLLLVVVIIPALLMHQADVFWDVGLALSSGLFLFLINQLIFLAAGNSRIGVIIVQTVSLVVFVAGFFVNYLFFVLLGLFLIILFTAGYRLKEDYVW